MCENSGAVPLGMASFFMLKKVERLNLAVGLLSKEKLNYWILKL